MILVRIISTQKHATYKVLGHLKIYNMTYRHNNCIHVQRNIWRGAQSHPLRALRKSK